MPILTPCADAWAPASKANATNPADENWNSLELKFSSRLRLTRVALVASPRAPCARRLAEALRLLIVQLREVLRDAIARMRRDLTLSPPCEAGQRQTLVERVR